MTKQNGVDVWPNAAIWMRDELRSKVRLPRVSVLSALFTEAEWNKTICLVQRRALLYMCQLQW